MKWDLLAISILLCIAACVVTAVYYNIDSIEFLLFVQFKPILYIIGMSIVIMIVDSQNIFQILAIRIIKLTQSNPRRLFYFLCMTGMIFSSIVEDVSVALIFIPLVIRACKVLRIDSKPFVLGITVCMNIGNMVAPFSNSQNIILSDAFQLNVVWFAKNMIPFALLTTIISIVVVDLVLLKHQNPPSEAQKKLLNELMESNLLVLDRRLYLINSSIFVLTILGFIIIPEIYLVSMVSALILCLINKKEFARLFEKLDWKIIGFFIVLFLIVGCMEINGTLGWMSEFMVQITGDNVFITAIVILIATSLVASILSPNPTALLFIPILQALFEISPVLAQFSIPIIIAFISGLNIGNFFPQGAPCYLATINIAQNQRIPEISYQFIAKNGALFSILHIIIAIGYIAITCLILGVFS